jgi:hypothetical protein
MLTIFLRRICASLVFTLSPFTLQAEVGFDEIRTAAIQGDWRSQIWMGNFHEFGIPSETDVRTAGTWYQRAAESGEIDARYAYACYLYRLGGHQNKAEALKILEISHQQKPNHIKVAIAYGKFVGVGIGAPRNVPAAKFIWQNTFLRFSAGNTETLSAQVLLDKKASSLEIYLAIRNDQCGPSALHLLDLMDLQLPD